MSVGPSITGGTAQWDHWRKAPPRGRRSALCARAWRTENRAYDDLAPSDMGGEETILFEADADWKLNKTVGRLRQGMHMPRWASAHA